MMNELHAGLHARYLEERREIERCYYCRSDWFVSNHSDTEDSFECYDCGEYFDYLPIETFEEWAERNDINLEEL